MENVFCAQFNLLSFDRLLVKFPELNYQLKIKVCIDKWVFFFLIMLRADQKDVEFIEEEKLPSCWFSFFIFQGIRWCGRNSRVRL